MFFVLRQKTTYLGYGSNTPVMFRKEIRRPQRWYSDPRIRIGMMTSLNHRDRRIRIFSQTVGKD